MFGKSTDYRYHILPHNESLFAPGSGYNCPDRSSLLPSHYCPGGNKVQSFPNGNREEFTDRCQSWCWWVCSFTVTLLLYMFTIITLPLSAWFVLKVARSYERIVVFRLGRVCPPKGPGVVFILPLIDQWQRVDLRTKAFNIPPCKVPTLDGGLVTVGADVQFRIWSPVMSVMAMQDLNASIRLTAQNAMTHSLVKRTVREIQSDKVKLGEILGTSINDVIHPWGVEVDRVELTMESVLKGPNGSEAALLHTPPLIPGLECLGPLQELALHFLSAQRPQPSTEKAVVTSERTADRADTRSTPQPLTITDLLLAVEPLLTEELVRSIRACFQLHISLPDGQSQSCFVDLSQGTGAAGLGAAAREPDVTFRMSQDDLAAMVTGELQPSQAFATGRMSIHGDVTAALKLDQLLSQMKRK